ncbi:MAG: hypothetical protein Phog2KO_10400 [Phototrophicaceae bacterium]
MTFNRSIGVWAVRLLLGALFLFGSEIILWTNPLEHSALDWLVRIVGYVLLATLTLDIAERYRIQDGYDAMVLIAGTALLHGLLINPLISWQIFPDSLLTRIIGADALVQIILWGIFLTWLRGDNRKYSLYHLVGGLWLGIFWGFWMRWTPELRGTFSAISLSQMAMIAGVAFILIVAFYYLVTVQSAKTLKAPDLVLSQLEWGIVLVVLISLFLVQAVLGAVGVGALLATVFLLALCWLILWLRRDAEQDTLLSAHLPLKAQSPLWIILLMAIFAGAVYGAYNLPLITDVAYVNQLWLMEVGSFAVGILWLPLVASVIATRAIDIYMREGFTL